MTTLEIYRDDGPLAGWVAAKVVPVGRPRPDARRLAWLVPPLLRLVEYGSLIALTALADPDALPICFALLGVLAFHHYDTVYRLRHQRLAPPYWVRAAGGGWEVRLFVASALALGGGLRSGLLAAAVALALLYVSESIMSWMRFGRTVGQLRHEDEDEDGD